MPIANGFLTPEKFSDEYFFELMPAFCPQCSMFQIIDQPVPEMMFHENYAFFSGTSHRMSEHFRDFASEIMAMHLSDEDPFVVEIGSNDGIMLRHFASAGIRHLGVEPSTNVAAVARRAGVRTICEFFDQDLARQLVREHGQADAVLAANVMCHISNLNSVAEGVDKLLKPDGLLIFEEPYLGDMIRMTSYDQIYDEHVFIFSVRSVTKIFARHSFELIDVKPQSTHGGSMRYVLARAGYQSVSPAVAAQSAEEAKQGLSLPETYERFRENCERSRDKLVALLQEKRQRGQRVVGYGATSKSATVLNYCGIGPELIEYISDTTPIKQGKFTPGSHIPVRPYEEFVAEYPDYSLLFAWNHKAEIFEKEKGFAKAGGQWIEFVPDIAVVGG